MLAAASRGCLYKANICQKAKNKFWLSFFFCLILLKEVMSWCSCFWVSVLIEEEEEEVCWVSHVPLVLKIFLLDSCILLYNIKSFENSSLLFFFVFSNAMLFLAKIYTFHIIWVYKGLKERKSKALNFISFLTTSHTVIYKIICKNILVSFYVRINNECEINVWAYVIKKCMHKPGEGISTTKFRT